LTGLTAAIGLAVVAGLAIPGLSGPIGPALPALLAVLMFLGCTNMQLGAVAAAVRSPARSLWLLAFCHVASPLGALAWGQLLPPGPLRQGLLLAAATSSGFGVVFLSRMVRGNPHQALPLTVLSNAAVPFLLPVTLLLLGGAAITVDAMGMARTLFLLVGVPVMLALLAQRTRLHAALQSHGGKVSLVLLTVLLAGVIAQVRPVLLANPRQALLVGGVVFALVAMLALLGGALGRTRAERVTFSLVASYKNYTLATVVALEHLGPEGALPAVAYALVNSLLLLPLAASRAQV
jgi:predicted Na+-dependent transporter